MATSSFKEWLTEQSKKALSEDEREDKKREWLRSLESLYSQLRSWLREDDPEEIVKTSDGTETIKEEEFGAYRAPSFRFQLSQRRVTATPAARNVIGPRRGEWGASHAEGRVDLTNGVTTFHLYRLRDADDKLYWAIVPPREPQSLAIGETCEILDKQTFQKALRRLFS